MIAADRQGTDSARTPRRGGRVRQGLPVTRATVSVPDVTDLDSASQPQSVSPHSGASASDGASRIRQWIASPALAVTAATLAFAAVCLGFLITTPMLWAPDELYHFDRVVAAEHGTLLPGPGSFNVAQGVRQVESKYVFGGAGYEAPGAPSWASAKPIPRAQRPSLNALGGSARSKAVGVSNYETQHPPLYYDVMGGLVRLWPGADAMAADKFVLLVRALNVLLMLTLPALFWFSAKWLLGTNAVSRAAPFLPLLVPGLARTAASINNDNLAIPFGALGVALAIRVFRGDRSLRTAVWIAATCLAGTLTKSTVVFALWIVPVAYIVLWIKERRAPSRSVFTALIVGALASSAWWIHNYIAYGAVQPSAWGSQFALAQGRPRGDIPIDYNFFVNRLYIWAPSRFWGALGLLEPPKLPHVLIVGMSALILTLPFLTLAALRGRRWLFVAIFAVPASEQLMVVLQAYLHYRHYLAIPGIQGRYVYPGVFGALLPFAVGAVLVLRRYSSWAPLLITLLGTLMCGSGVLISLGYSWLPRGSHLRPSNLHSALGVLDSFNPLGKTSVVALIALGALLVVGAFAGCVASCWTHRDERYGWAELRGDEPLPQASEPALVPAG